MLDYVGDELRLFSSAHNWKAYIKAQLGSYLRGDVLEVGAGLGGTTKALIGDSHTSWTCLEPDPQLVAQMVASFRELTLPAGSAPVPELGTLETLPSERLFDVILYMDVLEHIEHDHAELERAARHLRAGGHLVVLAPAHNFLYSPFDRSIGHFRRYDRPMLLSCTPPSMRRVSVKYLDCVGIAASLANRLLMRASMPTESQIRVWDRLMVPISRRLDPLLGNQIGKSIVAIWQTATS